MPPKKVNNTPPKKPFEDRMKEKKKTREELTYIAQRAIKERPSIRQFNQALRYLEVFAQLMKIKPFLKWMIANIEVHDQIDHKKKSIDTFVVYKGPESLGETPEGETPEVMFDLKDAEQPLCPPGPKSSPDQNIVRCPHCQIMFDANVDVPRIQLATDIPPELKK
jgi:hypothetical protein